MIVLGVVLEHGLCELGGRVCALEPWDRFCLSAGLWDLVHVENAGRCLDRERDKPSGGQGLGCTVDPWIFKHMGGSS